MKLAIDCECIIMQKALEIFLKDFLVDYELADFIVSDNDTSKEKSVFYISKDSPYMNLPFNKNELILALEEYNYMLDNKAETNYNASLEDKISNLVDEFKDNLIKTIKEHYE